MIMAAAAVQAIGSIRAGNTANAAAKYEAASMQRQADATISDGMAQDEMQRRKAREQIGLQLAASAEAGGGINEQSLRQSIYDAEMDSAAIRYGAMTRAQGLNEQAALRRWEGRQARTAGYLNAAGSLLNGASQAYGKKGG
jgi:hypothetical protein